MRTLSLLFSILISLSSFSHPLKMTASIIKYNVNEKKLSMECNVFIDDFENSINETLNKKIDVSNLTKADKEEIEKFFAKYYTININGNKIPFKYSSFSILKAENVLKVKFYKNKIKLKKGDKFKIMNTLFFKDFGIQQTNRITVQIPPFISNKVDICNQRINTVTFNL